jgi:hypothetical protein
VAGSGAIQGFDAAAFRTAIRAAMVMGAPLDTSQKTTFIFSDVSTYSPEDPDNNPYDWTQTPVTEVAERRVIVPAAVQYATAAVVGTTMGDFDATRAVITLLDVDYALVAGADLVLLGNTHYVLDPPGWIPLALFDVGVYQVHVTARG